AMEEAVLVLCGHEPGEAAGSRHPIRVGDLPAGEVRRTGAPDLALAHQFGERLQRLLDRGERIRGVELVEVDPVGVEPAKAVLDGDTDPRTGAAAVRAAGDVPELGCDDHV